MKCYALSPHVDAPHVLEAEVVGDFSGRQKGIVTKLACQERKTVEGDRVELRPIGQSLLD
jgi:hypothetical protein